MCGASNLTRTKGAKHESDDLGVHRRRARVAADVKDEWVIDVKKVEKEYRERVRENAKKLREPVRITRDSIRKMCDRAVWAG